MRTTILQDQPRAGKKYLNVGQISGLLIFFDKTRGEGTPPPISGAVKPKEYRSLTVKNLLLRTFSI